MSVKTGTVSAVIAWMRPAAMIATFVFVFTGWAASPIHPTDPLSVAADLLWLQVVHGLLLWGGSNALNGAEDDDDGPVNLLENPPPKPPHLATVGYVLLGLGGVVAATRGATTGALAAVAIALSIFYSKRGMPWPRGKDIVGVDLLINASGTGLGAVGLGWTATGMPITREGLYIGLAFSVATFGGIPTSQIFQLSRKERNWTSWLGPARALRLCALLFTVHVAMLAPLGPWQGVRIALLGFWAAATLGSAAHALWWSLTPEEDAYSRMTRQMGAMVLGQAAWALAWV